MLYDLNLIYCSYCKEFTPIFDAINYDLSATEIMCSNCGRILLIMKTKYQTGFDLDFNSKKIEEYMKQENLKIAKKASFHKVMRRIDTA